MTWNDMCATPLFGDFFGNVCNHISVHVYLKNIQHISTYFVYMYGIDIYIYSIIFTCVCVLLVYIYCIYAGACVCRVCQQS